MALTHSPDPSYLDDGAGTAAEQTARPRRVADPENGGWDDYVPPAPPATGATAGAPGAFTPAGCEIPANLTALRAGNVVASPATKWTVGQYVNLGTGTAYWDADSWETGAAPAVQSPPAFE